MRKNIWIDVNERLPDIDIYVLWWYESGMMSYECIDKDMDTEYIMKFLEGGEYTGRITHWMDITGPNE